MAAFYSAYLIISLIAPQFYLTANDSHILDSGAMIFFAPPIGQIHPFSKMAATFEPLMGFLSPLGFRNFLITMT